MMLLLFRYFYVDEIYSIIYQVYIEKVASTCNQVHRFCQQDQLKGSTKTKVISYFIYFIRMETCLTKKYHSRSRLSNEVT